MPYRKLDLNNLDDVLKWKGGEWKQKRESSCPRRMSSGQHRQWIEAYCNETMTPDEFSQFEQTLTGGSLLDSISKTVRARQVSAMAWELHMGIT